MSTVVITGAAGRIGRALCEGLPERGWTVRGTDIAPADGITVADLSTPDSEQVLADSPVGYWRLDETSASQPAADQVTPECSPVTIRSP